MNRQMTQGTVANNVQVIPATKRRVSAGGQLKKAKDIRVAAYGRVSTDELAQQTSYEGQKSYYTKLINEKEGWTFAGMYADEAISGTNRNHRTEFNQMMQDEKGITFKYTSEEKAKTYLMDINNYLRTAAYRQNYQKHTCGKNKGKYIKL